MGLIDQMMANLYKPPKQEKTNTVLPKNLTPAKVANLMNQTAVSQGQLLRGQVLDLRANQILVLLENGITVSARTEGPLELSIGQNAKFFVAQTTEEQILLKLAKEDTPGENPMVDKALSAANIQKTERSISIVTELLNHQQPVNEAGIRHYLSLSAKYPELPVKDLILMELHHIPVTKESVEQFLNYQDKNAKLLIQAQDMLQGLADTIEQMPEGPAKQEVLKELQQLTGTEHKTPEVSGAVRTETVTGSELPAAVPELTQAQETVKQTDTIKVIHPDNNTSPDTATLPDSILPEQPADSMANVQKAPLPPTDTRIEAAPLLKDIFDSFLLKPEDMAEPDKVRKYYEEINEKLASLEQISRKVAENTAEANTAAAPKQMRQNLSFMEAVNNVFPYIQLPLKFKETPAHGELYVYEKKKTMKPSDTLSALLHLEMEYLGTTDIYVTLSGNHVTTRFSMTDKSSGDLIRTELPKLTAALSAKGYTLQSEVTVREPEEENVPTLLEQFLEEHAPGGLNRYTFDIRA